VLDEEGNLIGYRGADADITERKQAEEQLARTQKLESIGRLAGGIAHDFGNILAVIMGSVSMLQRRRSLPAKVQQVLDEIAKAAERGSVFINQLLTYARGGVQKLGPTDLNQISESVVQIVRQTAARRIKMDLKLDAKLSTITADSGQVEQVVMNLCLNAIEASHPPSTIDVITEEQTLSSDEAAALELQEGRYACLRVRDRGDGMDAETVKHMFDPFFTTKPMGRGMGLSTTLGIIHRHHGQIRIDSAIGVGTTVSVWLPISQRALRSNGP
jgi:signal transduction histidine kinase